MSRRPDLRGLLARKLNVAAAVALHHVPETSRSTLLALSEIARRAERPDPSANELPATLTPYELRVFSQNGEDGVINEIVRRAGAPSRYFVEIGASSFEANCVLLADVFGWHGLFIDASERQYKRLRSKYETAADVAVRKTLVTPDNVERILADARVPLQLDVLSIDIDGEDYYLWEAIESHRPRVVVIEYNAALGSERQLVQPRGRSVGTALYGASIRALESLAAAKGYLLVHTELTGNNAFFVRDDLPGEFPDPSDVPRRSPNFYLRGMAHPQNSDASAYVDLEFTSKPFLANAPISHEQ